jgi:hypothetical protein
MFDNPCACGRRARTHACYCIADRQRKAHCLRARTHERTQARKQARTPSYRAASFGKTKAEATAPAAATRTNNIASNYLVG